MNISAALKSAIFCAAIIFAGWYMTNQVIDQCRTDNHPAKCKDYRAILGDDVKTKVNP